MLGIAEPGRILYGPYAWSQEQVFRFVDWLQAEGHEIGRLLTSYKPGVCEFNACWLALSECKEFHDLQIQYQRGVIELKMTPEDFVAMLGPVAQSVCAKYGLYASVCIAQGAIESCWNEATIGEFNLFGRKAVSGDKSIALWTRECGGPNEYEEDDTHLYLGDNEWKVLADFKLYDSLEEAVEDYCILLTEEPCYAPVIANLYDLEAYVYALAGDGENQGIYATDKNYGPSILATIRANDLRQYD